MSETTLNELEAQRLLVSLRLATAAMAAASRELEDVRDSLLPSEPPVHPEFEIVKGGGDA